LPERKTAEERKQEIVQSTLKLADNVGPDRLSAAMIARDIGISQPAIFRHFSGMSVLWLSVAEYIEKVMKKKWDKALSTGDDAPQQLQKLILTQLHLIQSIPAIPGILFSRELHAGNKGLRQAFAKIMQSLHGRIIHIIVSGQKSGHFNQYIPAEDSAYLIMSFIQGLVVRWSISGKSFNLPEEGQRLLKIQMHILLSNKIPQDIGGNL